MATCRTELTRQAGEILTTTLALPYEWRSTARCAVLFIPADTPAGFDVTLTATDEEIELTAGRFHSHFDDNPDPEDFIRHALGLVRDLLSPSMRLRELVAGGMPYRWYLESWHDDHWVSEEETGLLFWPYWARRSERLFVNRHLPARE